MKVGGEKLITNFNGVELFNSNNELYLKKTDFKNIYIKKEYLLAFFFLHYVADNQKSKPI